MRVMQTKLYFNCVCFKLGNYENSHEVKLCVKYLLSAPSKQGCACAPMLPGPPDSQLAKSSTSLLLCLCPCAHLASSADEIRLSHQNCQSPRVIFKLCPSGKKKMSYVKELLLEKVLWS